MATRNPQRKKTKMRAAVELAVLAVQGSPSVMDLPMTGFDPSPGALDLPEREHRETCSRCGGPAVEYCQECGSTICGDCAARNATELPI
jgi:hypothetical protein